MLLLYIGLTLSTLGKLILGFAVLRVHEYIFTERKIDGVVLRAIRRERYITFCAILCIIIGYVFEMYFYSNATFIS